MPVHLRTQAHGQGDTDLNFIIPELISGVDYRKGPYTAQIGDFSFAGGAKMFYADGLPQRIVLATLGGFGYRRAPLAGGEFQTTAYGSSSACATTAAAST